MKARYSYRCYPNPSQRRSLARLFGSVRVVYNDALALCKSSENLPSNARLQKQCITAAKKTESRHWLSEVSNIPHGANAPSSRTHKRPGLRSRH